MVKEGEIIVQTNTHGCYNHFSFTTDINQTLNFLPDITTRAGLPPPFRKYGYGKSDRIIPLHVSYSVLLQRVSESF